MMESKPILHNQLFKSISYTKEMFSLWALLSLSQFLTGSLARADIMAKPVVEFSIRKYFWLKINIHNKHFGW